MVGDFLRIGWDSADSWISKPQEVLESVRELIRVVEKGNDVGITPDGSRGPIYEAKPGAILLARITKSPICLLSFKYSGHRYESWDRFVIPFPFSRVKVYTHSFFRGTL